jgi:ribonuclease D
VIHNSRLKRRVLSSAGIELDAEFDTMVASRRLRGVEALGGHDLTTLCERELGAVLDKGVQSSNWSRRPLDAEQIRCAALDVEALLSLYDHFSGAEDSESALA